MQKINMNLWIFLYIKYLFNPCIPFKTIILILKTCTLYENKSLTVMDNNFTNINKTNNHVSPWLIKYTKNHDIWRWKSRSWLGTVTKMCYCLYLVHSYSLNATSCILTTVPSSGNFGKHDRCQQWSRNSLYFQKSWVHPWFLVAYMLLTL